MSKPTRGRPKGSLNRVTSEAKQAILMAFDKLGGTDRLVAWVNKDPANETLYWTKIFPLVVPRPAAEPVAETEALPPVKGALIWQKPTPSPHRPLSASTAAAAAAAGGAAVSGGAAPPTDRATGPPK